jgi:uncharacterized OB-fold protein
MADQPKSPLATFHEYCERGELAYQVNPADGSAVFYPRAVAPGTAEPNLEWRVSKGLGAVYATTTLHRRGEDPYDISMIELDEGFRMMSRVESVDPMDVTIGMRVKVRMIPETDGEPIYPVFDPVEG